MMMNMYPAGSVRALPTLVLGGVVAGAVAFGYNLDSFRLTRCLKEEPGPRFACFQDIVNTVAEKGDYIGAFGLVAEAYALDSDFAGNCHASVHEIGRIAYGRFAGGEGATFTSKASACGYGFYHGFMEALLAETGNISEARMFCDVLGEELFQETTDARGACYHGIGHGTVDGTDPRLWGDPRALVQGGIAICELVAGELPDIPKGTGPLYRCISGAYNSLEILSQNEKYGLGELAKDPFGFCGRESEHYRIACYTNMLPAVLTIQNKVFELIVADIDAIPSINDQGKAGLVRDLFQEFIRLNLDNGVDAANEALPLCQGLRDPLRIGCIEGLSGGHMKYGAPENEIGSIFHLCSSTDLSDDETSACWKYSLVRLRLFYSPEKARAICSSVPPDFQQFCRGAGMQEKKP